MKKSSMLIGLVVLIVLIGGGYALFHKSNKPAASSTTSNSSTTTSTSTSAVISTKTASGVGQYLATANGAALYTYGADTSGVSNCSGSCLANWPAYIDTGSTTGLPTNVSTIKRSDNNQLQYAYKGMPLYTFSADSTGQVTGDGVSNFHVAKP